jgi:hypothetical protein
MDLHTWQLGKIAPRTGNRQVDRLWDDVAQSKEIERAFVRNDCRVSPGGQPSGSYLFARRRRIVAESIDSAMRTNESAAAGMVSQKVAIEAAGHGLLRREVALLL